MPFLYGTKYKHLMFQSYAFYFNIQFYYCFSIYYTAYTFLALETKISKRINFYIQNTNNTWEYTSILLQMLIYLFIWGFTSLSTLYRSYHDG